MLMFAQIQYNQGLQANYVGLKFPSFNLKSKDINIL